MGRRVAGGKEEEKEREEGTDKQMVGTYLPHTHSTLADLMREREHRQKWEAAVVEWRDLTCNLTLEKFR